MSQTWSPFAAPSGNICEHADAELPAGLAGAPGPGRLVQAAPVPPCPCPALKRGLWTPRSRRLLRCRRSQPDAETRVPHAPRPGWTLTLTYTLSRMRTAKLLSLLLAVRAEQSVWKGQREAGGGPLRALGPGRPRCRGLARGGTAWPRHPQLPMHVPSVLPRRRPRQGTLTVRTQARRAPPQLSGGLGTRVHTHTHGSRPLVFLFGRVSFYT